MGLVFGLFEVVGLTKKSKKPLHKKEQDEPPRHHHISLPTDLTRKRQNRLTMLLRQNLVEQILAERVKVMLFKTKGLFSDEKVSTSALRNLISESKRFI